jgi:hypothetical protein
LYSKPVSVSFIIEILKRVQDDNNVVIFIFAL